MTTPTGILMLPRAHGPALGRAQVRACPEDFIVREWLGFSADGEGEHLLLKVRKRGANTLWVARQLARLAQVPPVEVGFAGLKDRDALAEQSFTVPARSARGDDWLGVAAEGFEVIQAQRHRRKLKRGALRGNEFQLVLRGFTGERAALEQRLRTLAAAGVPNYFGPQRFGREAGNLTLARAWFAGDIRPPPRPERGFALSAARAAIFNAVLAQRVLEQSWNRLLEGETVNLDGSGSTFLVQQVDEVLRQRCEQLDVHPTGPMWGRQSQAPAGTETLAAFEHQVAQRDPVLAAGLSSAGLELERRALRARVDELAWNIDGEEVRLQFRLYRGCFATAVLHELIDNAFTASAPEGEE